MEKVYWPMWFYGPDGQSQIFNGPLEVPDGWHDSPDKFGDDGKAVRGAKTDIPGYDDAVAEEEAKAEAGAEADAEEDDGERPDDDAADGDIPGYDDITKDKLREELDEMKVSYDRGDNKASLYTAFKAAKQAQASGDGGEGGLTPNTQQTGDKVIDPSLSGSEGQDQRPEMVAPMDQMSDDDINGRLTRAHVAYNTSWSKKRRYELLKDHLNEVGNRL